jgi:hypothetical protein
MKITAFLFTLAAASRTDGVRGYDASTAHADSDHTTSESVADHHLNGAGDGGIANSATDPNLIHTENIRPDGQYGSHRNQTTRFPTPAPTNKHDAFGNMHNSSLINSTGDTTVIDEQTGVSDMPTASPTKFPTKDQSDTDGKGTVCSDGAGFSRPVGWVGAGPGDQFCNVWKCNPGKTAFTQGNHEDNQGHFSKQVRVCSVEEHDYTFCSHTTCSFAANNFSQGKLVINVHSDHREETGGNHTCGYAKHGIANNADGAAGIYQQDMGSHITSATRGAQTATRPECDCVCYGPKRQNATNFARVLNNLRVMPGNEAGTDETTNNNHAYDTANNHNNFYSKHSHADTYVETGNNNAGNNYVGSNVASWAKDGSGTHQNGATRTEYLENEAGARNGNSQYQNDQYVAHSHQDGTDNSNPYDESHKSAALYSGN